TTESTEVTVETTETVEETEVTEVDVEETEGKKPESKKHHRKPKRKPTTSSTTEETTETVEETTETVETVETSEDVPATSYVTEVIEVTTAAVSAKPEEKTSTTETTETREIEDGEKDAVDASVKTEVFRTVGANGSIITKTVRTTIRTVTTSTGVVKRVIEVRTTTDTETTTGEKSSSVETETREEVVSSGAAALAGSSESSATTTTTASASDATLVSSSTQKDDEDAAGASVKTEVFRTVGANGSIITKTVRTTIRTVTTSTGVVKRVIEVRTTTDTETTTGEKSSSVETETREEVVSSGAAALAGSSESSATTTTTASASDATLVSSSTQKDDEDAAGASVKTEVFRTVGANGSIITKTVRTTIRTVTTSTGVVKRVIEVRTTTDTETTTGEKSTSVTTEMRTEEAPESVIDVAAVVDTDGTKRGVETLEEKSSSSSATVRGESEVISRTMTSSSTSEALEKRTGKGSAWWSMKRRRLVKTWLPQFVSYVQRRGRSLSKSMPRKELLNFARDFCDQNFVSFEDGFFNAGTYEEKRATWTIARSLSFHYPGVAVQELGLGIGKFERTLLIDEVYHARNGPDGTPLTEVELIISALQVVPKKCAFYEDVLVLENGEVLFHGTGESLMSYFQELGFVCAPGVAVSDYLLNLTEEQQVHHQVTMIQGFNNQRQLRRNRMFAGLMKFADDMVFITGAPGAGGSSRSTTPVSSPARSSSTARMSTSYSPLRRQLKHKFARGSPAQSPFSSPMATRTTTSTTTSAAGSASPQSTGAARAMKITSYSSPESSKVTKTAGGATTTTTYSSPVTTTTTSYSSPVTKVTSAGSTATTRNVIMEGGNTVTEVTEEVTSPDGSKRMVTTRHVAKSSPSSTAASGGGAGLRSQQQQAERTERELMNLKMEAAHLRERLQLRVGGDATAAELEAEAFTLKKALAEAQEALAARSRQLGELDDKYHKALRGLIRLDEAWKQSVEQEKRAEAAAEAATQEAQAAQRREREQTARLEAAARREETLTARVDALTEGKQSAEQERDAQTRKTLLATTHAQELRAQLEATRLRVEAQRGARAGATREDVERLESALQKATEDAAARRGEAKARQEEGAALERELRESREVLVTTRQRLVKLTEELAVQRVYLTSAKQSADASEDRATALETEKERVKKELKERSGELRGTQQTVRALEGQVAKQKQAVEEERVGKKAALEAAEQRAKCESQQLLQAQEDLWRTREEVLQQEVEAAAQREQQTKQELAQLQALHEELAQLLQSAGDMEEKGESRGLSVHGDATLGLKALVEHETRKRRTVTVELEQTSHKLVAVERRLAAQKQLERENATLRADYDKAKLAMERMATRKARSAGAVTSSTGAGRTSVKGDGGNSSSSSVEKERSKENRRAKAPDSKRKVEASAAAEDAVASPRKSRRTKRVFVASRYRSSASKR
ncbi:hypothetical protein BBJ28_00011787, partial [Nothophytophthora sp. Chile5]